MKVVLAVLALVALVNCNLLITIEPTHTRAVTFSVTNQGESAIEFLTYGTPFDGETLFFPILNVTSLDGTTIPFIGPVARFVYPPPPSAYVNLPARSTLSVVLRISEFYDFPAEGDYLMSVVIPRFNPSLREARFSEEPISARLVPGLGLNSHSRADKFTNCKSAEQSQVAAATDTATNQATNAYNCMNRQTCNSLTTQWFGNSPSTRPNDYNYDLSTFSKVSSSLSSNGINAYCNPAGCGANVYGYVYPFDTTKTVYLCGAFFSVPTERANTIVHEESHFNANGGTEDYTYGSASCLALAKSSPGEASHNADNVCFFSAAV